MASQSQSSAFESLSSAFVGTPPAELLHGGKRWRAIEHAPNKKRNSKRSRAWSFSQEYESVDDSSVRAWRCNICPKDAVVVLFNKQINPANRHLESKHARIWDGTKEKDTDKDATKDEEVSGLVQKANITDFRFYLMRWIVRHHLPFDIVEDEDFQEVVKACNIGVQRYLVCGTTIRN